MTKSPAVLIVDDHPLVAAAAAHLLSTMLPDGRVDQVGSLSAALTRLREHAHYDLILLDLSLPDAKGAAVVQSVKLASPRSKVIVFTAIENALVKRHALDLGADRVLGKWESPDELAVTLHDVLGMPLPDSALPGVQGLIIPPPELTEPEPVVEPENVHPIFAALTIRQRGILREIASGRSNAEIALRFELAENTVKSHVHSLLSRVGAKNRTEAARWYIREVENRQSAQNPTSK